MERIVMVWRKCGDTKGQPTILSPNLTSLFKSIQLFPLSSTLQNLLIIEATKKKETSFFFGFWVFLFDPSRV
ncbi:hypothetical protein L2E82_25494 [Cichorium intybus]|uniref:Uncharacterized protein n=1 Tax=Cichorium intybus TaxID=13427 RepID=A0ACB9E3T5_CICIN|nr:hypothetical protein L2E82_25494 [Cichorium intybus]